MKFFTTKVEIQPVKGAPFRDSMTVKKSTMAAAVSASIKEIERRFRVKRGRVRIRHVSTFVAVDAD